MGWTNIKSAFGRQSVVERTKTNPPEHSIHSDSLNLVLMTWQGCLLSAEFSVA